MDQTLLKINLRNRPNKLAKGMTQTIYRSGHTGERLSSDACRLSVRGTLDTLTGLVYKTTRLPCSHCGCKAKGGLILKDSGRARLRQLRERAAVRAGRPDLVE